MLGVYEYRTTYSYCIAAPKLIQVCLTVVGACRYVCVGIHDCILVQKVCTCAYFNSLWHECLRGISFVYMMCGYAACILVHVHMCVKIVVNNRCGMHEKQAGYQNIGPIALV